MVHQTLNQVLCAALVDRNFCRQLLSDPLEAISAGYLEYNFYLTQGERDFVQGIRAERLEDFAAQVYGWIARDTDQFRAKSRFSEESYGGENIPANLRSTTYNPIHSLKEHAQSGTD